MCRDFFALARSGPSKTTKAKESSFRSEIKIPDIFNPSFGSTFEINAKIISDSLSSICAGVTGTAFCLRVWPYQCTDYFNIGLLHVSYASLIVLWSPCLATAKPQFVITEDAEYIAALSKALWNTYLPSVETGVGTTWKLHRNWVSNIHSTGPENEDPRQAQRLKRGLLTVCLYWWPHSFHKGERHNDYTAMHTKVKCNSQLWKAWLWSDFHFLILRGEPFSIFFFLKTIHALVPAKVLSKAAFDW